MGWTPNLAGRAEPLPALTVSIAYFLVTMPDGKVVKSVFDMLWNFNKQGFETWTTRVCELARGYDININEKAYLRSDQFKSMCFDIIKQDFFFGKWNSEIYGGQSTILETYTLHKSHYLTEAYLDLISNPKHCIALSRLWASSHNLKIGP